MPGLPWGGSGTPGCCGWGGFGTPGCCGWGSPGCLGSRGGVLGPLGAVGGGHPAPLTPPSPQPDDPGVGPKIPQALEKILQLKEIRQEELITVPGLSGEPPAPAPMGAPWGGGWAAPRPPPRALTLVPAAEDEMETELRVSASASEAEEDAGLSKKEVGGTQGWGAPRGGGRRVQSTLGVWTGGLGGAHSDWGVL